MFSLRNVTKDVRLLSLGFGLLFFSYGPLVQYLSLYYQKLGNQNTGLISVILTYASLAASSFFAPSLVMKFGAKRSMVASAAVYMSFGLTILFGNTLVLYAASVVVGFFAAILWTAQGCYILHGVENRYKATNGGYFLSVFSIFMTVGIIALSVMIGELSYKTSFVVVMIGGFLSPIILLKIRDVEITKDDSIKGVSQAWILLSDRTLWKFFLLCSLFYIEQGFSVGQLPLLLKGQFGETSVKTIIPLFYLIPFIVSFPSGKIADKMGLGRLVVFCCVAMALSFAMIAFSHSVSVQISGLIGLAISSAILQPALQALPKELVSPGKIKNLVSIRFLFLSLGNILGIFIPMVAPLQFLYLVVMMMSLGVAFVFLKSENKKFLLDQKI